MPTIELTNAEAQVLIPVILGVVNTIRVCQKLIHATNADRKLYSLQITALEYVISQLRTQGTQAP